MSDDLLKHASRALREAGDIDDEDAALVRARILASLGEKRRKRSRKVLMLVPLAAVLVTTTALATTNEGFSRAIRNLVARIVEPEEARTPAEPVGKAPASSRSRVDTPVEPELAMNAPLPEEAEPPSPAPVEEPAAAPKREKPKPIDSQPEPPSSQETAPRPADLARFERAYELHFVVKDYERALLAWEGYLRTSPDGQLAVEARYNRAMALVRLGRHDEAKAALEPFARGAFGGYRQSEAQAILAALP